MFSGYAWTWKFLTFGNESSANGVSFGNNLYVGGVTINGTSLPAAIDDIGRCTTYYNGFTRVLSGCLYLWDEPQRFHWISSMNGTIENGAVSYNNVAIGRIVDQNGKMQIGRVSNLITDKCLFYSVNGLEYRALNYDALVYRIL